MFISPGILPSLRKVGYLPFHTTIFSDHCALWADFDSSLMFLGEVGTPLDASRRQLKSSNLKSAQKYVDLLLNMFQDNSIIK